MALSVAAPTAGVLPILGAVVIGTLDSSGNFVQYASVSYKAPVRVATTVAGTLATSFANGQTVDGIVLATGDRILIKNQVAAADNGIYVVAATGAPVRASDFDSWTEIPGAVVGVLVGTANADTAWLCTSDTGGTLGSTAINFTQFGAGVVYPITPQLGGTGVANNSASTLTISGNFGTTITVTGATSVTLPTTGTLATLAGIEALSNKTISGPAATMAGAVTANAANAGATVVLQGYPGSEATLSGLWFGVTPTTGNFTVLSNPGSNVTINGPGGVDVRISVQLDIIANFQAARCAFAKPAQLKSYIVADLPAGAIGDTAFVTDASTTIILGLGLAVVGSGGNKVPVYYDGAWKIG